MSVNGDYGAIEQAGSSQHGNREVQKTAELAQLLGKHTAVVHKQLEETGFGKRWSEGTISETEYVMYLADLYHIYFELEKQLESLGHLEFLAPLRIQGLYRLKALEKDMEHFNVPLGAASEASLEYQRRLWVVGNQDPHLLIAHIWVRYMGDLNGGQIAKKKIESLWPGSTAFYEYEQLKQDHSISYPSRFVTPFRKILNSLELSEKEKEEISAEALWAFKQHLKIFEELSEPSMQRFVYAYAVPFLMNWNPFKLADYLPDRLKIWQR